MIGDMEPVAFAAMATRCATLGFTDFKIKLSGNLTRDAAKVDALRGLSINGLRVRADANNLWRDDSEALPFLTTLGQPFWALEEPAAARDRDALARIADACGCPVILDESVVRVGQFRALAPPVSRWIVNVRVSKMGGLLRSLDVVREARARGIPVVVGAQVGETSVLTRRGFATVELVPSSAHRALRNRPECEGYTGAGRFPDTLPLIETSPR